MHKPFVCLALALGLMPVFSSLRAQEGPPEQYEPPPPIGVDADLFIPPKTTLYLGFRTMTGPKISVSGTGSIMSRSNPGDPNDSTITSRTYDDGTINPDARIDSVSGSPLPADGRTNSWSFDSLSQITANGVAMHTSSATIEGSNPQSGKADKGTGFELTLERDFGWHLGRIQIDLIAGLGANDIHYIKTATVPAVVTTRTDLYSTFNTVLDPTSGDPVLDGSNTNGGNPTFTAGPPAPTAPYSAPSTTTDVAGNSVSNSTLINSTPDSSSVGQPVQTNAEVTDKWRVRGAYFTMRAGPKITVPITERFHASVSAGPALLYVGTTLSVTQTIDSPSVSTSNVITDGYSTVLPAYFADADLEYWLSDRAGFYAGAVFQSSTSYDQSIHSGDGSYTSKIDLSNEQGVRMGVNFKF
ncbi:MAG TPA: hypothetical protein VK717_02020 [Opitutaceae bacterium]|jgi:hypothetical protein|nr:hypothetical protein [Opitutaceae bacterium]